MMGFRKSIAAVYSNAWLIILHVTVVKESEGEMRDEGRVDDLESLITVIQQDNTRTNQHLQRKYKMDIKGFQYFVSRTLEKVNGLITFTNQWT